MNPELDRLQAYPFQRLAALTEGVSPPPHLSAINLSIGEPKHQPPAFVAQELISHLHGLAHYPLTRGRQDLRQAIADWLVRRFRLAGIDADHQVLPVNGTREALFAFAQAVVDRSREPLVLMPNPFYQIYEGAALLAGAEPGFLNTTAGTGLLPDFDAVPAAVWDRCQLIYVCSPGNPTGAVIPREQLQKLIGLADRHDFIIAADECYSELYPDESRAPTGLLEVCANIGRHDFRRCVVFHSLSKRSNLPGLRSGFVAGDADILRAFLLYRTYHGSAMPPPTQAASLRAWQDEEHVRHNRELYREKFAAVLEILQPVIPVNAPEAGFYLWPETPVPDTEFAQRLVAEQNVTVLPGSFLSRDTDTGNPGERRVRMALVATLDECVAAASRIRNFIENL